jgi:repressor LexA
VQKPLSTKQQQFLDLIQRHALTYGQSPSYVEIMSALRFSSLGTVNWYVKTLIKNGHLNRTGRPNSKRALTLTEKHLAPARLPLLGFIAAGTPIEALENAESVEVPAPLVHPDNFVLKIKGDSMIDDHIEDGDYIIVRKTQSAEPGQAIVALINGEATLKRYYPQNQKIELHPRNPDYPIIHINETDDFQINGIVLYSFREY